MRPFTELLISSTTFVGDGGMATELQSRGLQLSQAPECWNLTRPNDVIAVHRSYVEAGAQWLQTNTFGGTRSRLERCGLASEADEVNRAAVHCARAASADVPVLGSIGPCSADASEWEPLFSIQCEALAAAKVEGYIVETIVSLAEGLAAVRAAVRAGSGPVIASFTPGPSGALLDDTKVESAAESLLAAGAAVIGVNCGEGPEHLLPVAARLVRLGIAPVLAAPNAGLPVATESGLRYALSPDGFARAAIEFQQIGVRMLAGCCGTAPEHIRAAVAAIGVRETGREPS